jgi:hypothetical protein
VCVRKRGEMQRTLKSRFTRQGLVKHQRRLCRDSVLTLPTPRVSCADECAMIAGFDASFAAAKWKHGISRAGELVANPSYSS